MLSVCLTFAASVLTALDSRLATMERERTSVAAAAEATVARMKASPNAVIEVPRQWCWGFHQEMVGRAGGLAQIGNPDIDQPEDIVLFAVRSWGHFGPKAAELLRGWKGMAMLNAENTCMNFDERPFGFRLLTVRPDASFTWEFQAI